MDKEYGLGSTMTSRTHVRGKTLQGRWGRPRDGLGRFYTNVRTYAYQTESSVLIIELELEQNTRTGAVAAALQYSIHQIL